MILYVRLFLMLIIIIYYCSSDNTCPLVDEMTDIELQYHQYCCVEKNKGKSFILTNDYNENHYILCPYNKTPTSCSSIHFFSSCSTLLSSYPLIPSGYYNLRPVANGAVITAYCNMEGDNCGGEGGWTRLALMDMSDPNQLCPEGFRLYEEQGVRGCGRQSTGCESVTFPSHNITYSKVCGQVHGYQKGTTDAVQPGIPTERNDINRAYVDGVSLTRGSPRQHIWTFMVALQENSYFMEGHYVCPCAPAHKSVSPSFVGNDYFCESGQPAHYDYTTLLINDTLWDGQQCGTIEQECCNAHPSLPWFTKDLQESTTDYIELRACADFKIDDEDVAVSYYEIYVN